MISTNCWVPRGFASEFPEQYQLTEEELEKIEQLTNTKLLDAKQDLKEEEEKINSKSLQSQEEIDDDLKEFDFEHYDDDEQENEDIDIQLMKNAQKVNFLPGLSNDAKYIQENDDDDPYLSLPSRNDEDDDDDDEFVQEEKLHLQIYPTDNLVLSGRTEDDVSYLDVYVYDDGAGAPEGSNEEELDKLDPDVKNGMMRESNLYVHHDIMIPAFPLCVEWLSFQPMTAEQNSTEIGNFAAIGTFDPQIEIWNLDIVDKAFPDAILGEQESQQISKKKKKKINSGHITTHHTDAILSLSSNKFHRNILASSSADKTIKIWDLVTCQAVESYNKIHNNKPVSSIQWHATDRDILLSGGYDSKVAISSIKQGQSKYWQVQQGEEVENVTWGKSDNLFYCGTDSGTVYGFDIRNENKPLWKLQAHDSGISSLQSNSFVDGLLITSGMNDKIVKLWQIKENKPHMVLSRDFGVGNVLSTSFANDIEVAGHVVIGGVSGPLKMWDVFSNKTIRKTFSNELRVAQEIAKQNAATMHIASRFSRKYNDKYTEQFVQTDNRDNEDQEDDDKDGDADMNDAE